MPPRAETLATLRASGRRVTVQRQTVLDVVEGSARHLDAEAIYQLARVRDHGISLATVYRTLAVLKNMGLVEQSYLARDHAREHYEPVGSPEHYHFTCLGCHKVIGAQDNPEIAKIQDYAARGEPIPWVRVFKVPEFTYFPHKSHVRAGVTCQSCHGPIEQMRVVGARTGPRLLNDLANLIGLNPDPPPLSMGWCVDCHRRENAARDTQAPLDCIACHH